MLVRRLPVYYEGLVGCNNMVVTYCTEGDTSYELASPNVIAMLCALLVLGIFAANKVAGVVGIAYFGPLTTSHRLPHLTSPARPLN